jgi:hypothetical protein
MRSSQFLFIVAAGSFLGLGCGEGDLPPKPTEPEPPFHQDLLKIAANFQVWGRVDDEARWAPFYCRAPLPGRVAFSSSADEQTHGQKLYSLFARHRQDYVALTKGKKVAAGQVIVKQSWVPEEITDPKQMPSREIDSTKEIRTTYPKVDPGENQIDHETDSFYPYVWKGDKVFKATKQGDLFIMMKVDPQTPNTDEGWVYGTVTPDGKKVTSAGKVESCMKCHQEAKCERLFGLVK